MAPTSSPAIERWAKVWFTICSDKFADSLCQCRPERVRMLHIGERLGRRGASARSQSIQFATGTGGQAANPNRGMRAAHKMKSIWSDSSRQHLRDRVPDRIRVEVDFKDPIGLYAWRANRSLNGMKANKKCRMEWAECLREAGRCPFQCCKGFERYICI